MAIKLPNDKICYNLPEQVAANAENIASLAEQWNDYKTELDTDWGNYKTVFDGYINTWENEILPVFEDIPNAVGTAINGLDITPITIAQQQPNWKYEATPNILGIPSGIETEIVYFRCQQLNQSLHIIFLIKFKNPTASGILIQYPVVELAASEFPDYIKEKIIGIDGQDFKTHVGNHDFVCNVPTLKAKLASDLSLQIDALTQLPAYIDMVSNTHLQIKSYFNTTIGAGHSWVYEGRVELDLI